MRRNIAYIETFHRRAHDRWACKMKQSVLITSSPLSKKTYPTISRPARFRHMQFTAVLQTNGSDFAVCVVPALSLGFRTAELSTALDLLIVLAARRQCFQTSRLT